MVRRQIIPEVLQLGPSIVRGTVDTEMSPLVTTYIVEDRRPVGAPGVKSVVIIDAEFTHTINMSVLQLCCVCRRIICRL